MNCIAISHYLDAYQRERDITQSTVYQYRAAVGSFDKFLGRVSLLADLCRDVVNSWIISIQGHQLSPHTVAGRRRHLLALWRAAHDDGLVDNAPRRIRPVRTPRVPPSAWSLDEVRLLLSSAESLGGCYDLSKCWRADWWSLYLRAGWDTGLRTCDLLALRLESVDKSGVAIVVQSKTGLWQAVKLRQSTLDASARLGKRDLLLPWPYTPEHLRFQWQRVLAGCAVKGPLKRLRKSSASNVESHHPGCGRQHLGHKMDISDRHYLDPRIIAARKPMPEEL